MYEIYIAFYLFHCAPFLRNPWLWRKLNGGGGVKYLYLLCLKDQSICFQKSLGNLQIEHELFFFKFRNITKDNDKENNSKKY